MRPKTGDRDRGVEVPTELAHRAADGVDVLLLWVRDDDLRIVDDARTGESFKLSARDGRRRSMSSTTPSRTQPPAASPRDRLPTAPRNAYWTAATPPAALAVGRQEGPSPPSAAGQPSLQKVVGGVQNLRPGAYRRGVALRRGRGEGRGGDPRPGWLRSRVQRARHVMEPLADENAAVDNPRRFVLVCVQKLGEPFRDARPVRRPGPLRNVVRDVAPQLSQERPCP
jgi:hypothetical protein